MKIFMCVLLFSLMILSGCKLFGGDDDPASQTAASSETAQLPRPSLDCSGSSCVD